MFAEKVYEGIHPTAQININKLFDKKEKQIINQWANQWYITVTGKKTIGNSDYKYALAKPTSHVEEALSISKEIVLIFSPYTTFEARTLDAYNVITADFQEQRFEKICYVLIANDEKIEETIKEYLTNQEDQIVIPFTYSSFKDNSANPNFIKNQFRKFFYSRDLFDYSEPLKKDTFFFGRNDIVTQIINKHRNGLNFGLFGLRKTGKTSIIYDVVRKSTVQNFITVVIDCQNPSFNMRKWHNALFYVVNEIKEKINSEQNINEEDFTEQNATYYFERYVKLFKKETNQTILILFDEIENITFGKSSVKHWNEELDFVFFWQSIRSVYQATNEIFTFCIFGTNAKCIEDATILEKDNPIFNMFQPYYIPGFDHDQTRAMVRKLGRIMGIKFDEGIYTRLVEDYGGHPFLIRRVCSKISQQNPERPVTIDRTKYTNAKTEFNIENNYFDMILQVLKQFYPDEFEMLKLLARKDYDSFNYFVMADRSMINHLEGYGLISENDGMFDFKIDAIKDYIIRNDADHIELKTAEEKWNHLCSQRNNIEIELRKIVKTIIKIAYKNENSAKEYVISKVFNKEKKYANKTYSQLFDSHQCNIYLSSLTKLITSNWDYFSDYFGKQDVFLLNMNILNTEGRFDAHATIPDESEIAAVDNAIHYLQKSIQRYKDANE